MADEREPNRYDPLKDAHRRTAEAEEARRLQQEQEEQGRDAVTGIEANPDPNSPDARLSDKQLELEGRLKLGQITRGEYIYELRKFDNQLGVENERGGAAAPQSSDAVHKENAAADERGDATSAGKERGPEREAASSGEMPDASTTRRNRLRGIHTELEAQRMQREAEGTEPGRPTGDRSR